MGTAKKGDKYTTDVVIIFGGMASKLPSISGTVNKPFNNHFK